MVNSKKTLKKLFQRMFRFHAVCNSTIPLVGKGSIDNCFKVYMTFDGTITTFNAYIGCKRLNGL